MRDRDIAVEIERAEARNAVLCGRERARLHSAEFCSLDVAGGIAVFAGMGTPMTQLIGAAVGRPASCAELERAEEFFRARSAEPRVVTCPFTDETAVRTLRDRGYTAMGGFVALVASPPSQPVPAVQVARTYDAGLWARTVARGFLECDEIQADIEVGAVIAGIPGIHLYLAMLDGEAGGAAALTKHGRVGIFFGDATPPRFRGQRVQSALIAARLNAAREIGCDVVTACTLPNVTSYRNYVRAGFRPIYQRHVFLRSP